MLNKTRNFVVSWYYNIFMVILWGLTMWRGVHKGWYIMVSIAGLLCVLHLVLFISALMDKKLHGH
ncbi:hypothetical protein LCGC14_0479850 [marine sediment metagenome]|uniref:Uncharacterized protein n=1 Tax=marine sediment metagenome TaxID=412755 RepID=A0A0F9SF59_9ZZZZ